MNAEFFRKVLSSYEKEPDLNILNVEILAASAKGDHYASIMFRGKISYNTQKGKFSKSLIIKTMPEVDGFKKEFCRIPSSFRLRLACIPKCCLTLKLSYVKLEMIPIFVLSASTIVCSRVKL